MTQESKTTAFSLFTNNELRVMQKALRVYLNSAPAKEHEHIGALMLESDQEVNKRRLSNEME